MSGEISINDLAAESGRTATCITQLVKRGILPPGRKDGKVRLLPRVESLLILTSQKPGEHWVKNRPRPGKRKHGERVKSETPLTWGDVL